MGQLLFYSRCWVLNNCYSVWIQGCSVVVLGCLLVLVSRLEILQWMYGSVVRVVMLLSQGWIWLLVMRGLVLWLMMMDRFGWWFVKWCSLCSCDGSMRVLKMRLWCCMVLVVVLLVGLVIQLLLGRFCSMGCRFLSKGLRVRFLICCVVLGVLKLIQLIMLWIQGVLVVIDSIQWVFLMLGRDCISMVVLMLVVCRCGVRLVGLKL